MSRIKRDFNITLMAFSISGALNELAMQYREGAEYSMGVTIAQPLKGYQAERQVTSRAMFLWSIT